MINKQVEKNNYEYRGQKNNYGRLRVSLAILAVIVTSLNIHYITTVNLRHSRNLQRVLNRELLQHDDLDIYWFGYRTGQLLINYPIHQYYFIPEFGQFLERLTYMMGNLEEYSFAQINQTSLNETQQKIKVQYYNATESSYTWTIAEGIVAPINITNEQSIKEVMSSCHTLQIIITGVKMADGGRYAEEQQEWNIIFFIQPFSRSSIFVNILLQEKIYLGIHHIPHFFLGLATACFIYVKLKKRGNLTQLTASIKDHEEKPRNYSFEPSDIPDFLVIFFLIYSSIVSFTNMFTPRFVLLLDGVTCFICWLYILKIQTENDNYHISFLIRRSYVYVGRLFVSFGPMFIGFCLFAITVFCRYSPLFTSFHKTLISLFCVCYYNMTYEEFRTTQRTDPISTIFFLTLVMLFTVCIYSGMLVSVFCSYMWNKKQQKNKQELLHSLKIECGSCHHKYSYTQGAETSLKISVTKNNIGSILVNPEDLSNVLKFRKFINQTTHFIEHKIVGLIGQSELLISNMMSTEYSQKLQIWQDYQLSINQCIQKIEFIQKEFLSEENL